MNTYRSLAAYAAATMTLSGAAAAAGAWDPATHLILAGLAYAVTSQAIPQVSRAVPKPVKAIVATAFTMGLAVKAASIILGWSP